MTGHNACCPGSECVDRTCQAIAGDGDACRPVTDTGKLCIDVGTGEKGPQGEGHVTVNVVVNNVLANT